MKFSISVLTIAILGSISGQTGLWWSVAVVAFLVSLLLVQTPGKAFLSGFLGAGLCWLTFALLSDMANDHLLSGKMAALLHLPGYKSFILLTVIPGALIGGLGSWAASLIKTGVKSAA